MLSMKGIGYTLIAEEGVDGDQKVCLFEYKAYGTSA